MTFHAKVLTNFTQTLSVKQQQTYKNGMKNHIFLNEIWLLSEYNILRKNVLSYFIKLKKPCSNFPFLKSTMDYLRLNQHKQVPFQHIVYLESDANYTNVHTTFATKFLSSYTIGILYKRLGKTLFYRANRRLVFNLSFMDEVWYEGEYVFVNLSSGKHVALSRRQSSYFKDFLKFNFGYKIPYRHVRKGFDTLNNPDKNYAFTLLS
jgi:hypothetical protein